MTDEDPQNYEIETIQRADAPAGAEGSAWCRYVIKRLLLCNNFSLL